MRGPAPAKCGAVRLDIDPDGRSRTRRAQGRLFEQSRWLAMFGLHRNPWERCHTPLPQWIWHISVLDESRQGARGTPGARLLMVLRSLTSFGKVDAESDIGLADFFIETPSYTDIENQNRLLVVGRKGAGKTAIYSTLLRRSQTTWNDVFASGLDFRNYPWDLHDAACSAVSSDSERYAPLWQFLILIELSKLVLRQEPKQPGRDGRRAQRRLKRFIKRNWGTVDTKVAQIFTRTSYKLTVEPKAFGFSLFSLNREKVPREKLAVSLASVNEWLCDTLATILDRESLYFVLLDDLDGDFGADDAAARDRLIGLLVAAREIRIWARTSRLPFTPVVFMRSDIYATLRFPSKNKISTGDLEEIAWSDEEDNPTSLKALIAQRVAAVIGYASNDPWREVFTGESIDGNSLYEFMAAHTHLRPRDMIQLANACLDCANGAQASHIGANHIQAALPAYSKYLLNELTDAAHQSVTDWDEHIMTLRRIGEPSFDRAKFAKEHELGSSDASVDHSLRDLYGFGAIGYVQGSNVIFAHASDSAIDSGATLFEVHPGIQAALGLTSRLDPGEGDTNPA